ncbi:Predicted ATP-dependent endonuclease of the OLD family, contains P-loop ATPase and TOPRIM domains [Pedobacter steynii]|uniref:Predicted ATP-dependent endonuclease of the OLD family, contains P-loop ATPase and TOPRIM domains n=1 Tax=Pedobacter steynii TaxID=430522 RepID=A0A1H0KBJ0_9SPHI|nr:AAA family ATPase [Pedobacter steynii]NQX43249.1 AAA family ATPase [Pedobacter steynii]SDO53298.1 Predicted ATP-dependent endonuclease of the OLD family, contains P-loop ATPase and TOPRIM domains [Pedobacter steynii]
MRITKLKIQGFRSFGTESIIKISGNLSTFIGLNSSGKTAALESLRKLFGNTNQERELSLEDFHVAQNEDTSNTENKSLSIEVRIEFEEEEPESIPHFFNHMVVDDEGKKPYLRLRLESTWTKSLVQPDGDIVSMLYFIKVPEGETEDEDTKQLFPNYLKNLFQVIYVPAIRKPYDQIRYATGTMLFRVLRNINWEDSFKEKFKDQMNSISNDFKEINEVKAIQESISGYWSKFHKDERYSSSDLNFGGNDVDSVLKKLEVSFSPSATIRPYSVNDLGEGYRSLFYLTLVCALLDLEEKAIGNPDEIGITKPLLTILAIEEPENHIAPQLLGRVIKILSTIGEKKNSQIFISCHTPAIVKRIPPESILHFRITSKFETAVSNIVLPKKSDEAYKYIKEAIRNYPEIYFAKLVVIGEGDSEEVLFNRLMQVKNVDFDDNIITFAPLGHRFVNHIWKLLKTLSIPFVTLLDLDTEREGGDWGRIKYVCQQLMDFGVKREDILSLEDGKVMSTKDFDELHKVKIKVNEIPIIKSWVKFLESYDVFYSFPLDLDFLMLEHFTETYKNAIPKNGGPEIPDEENEEAEFKEKLSTAIQATLKSKSATGAIYSESQKRLMIWYNYHFLGRGKPSTHIQALSLLKDNEILKNLPPVFNAMFTRISEKLK